MSGPFGRPSAPIIEVFACVFVRKQGIFQRKFSPVYISEPYYHDPSCDEAATWRLVNEVIQGLSQSSHLFGYFPKRDD